MRTTARPTGDRRRERANRVGGRKLVIWTTRWGRHKSGASRGCQPKEPLERPANTTKSTRYQTQNPSGSTQTRPKRTCFCNVRLPKFAWPPARRLTEAPPSEYRRHRNANTPSASTANDCDIEWSTSSITPNFTTNRPDTCRLTSSRPRGRKNLLVSGHSMVCGQQNETSTARSVEHGRATPTAWDAVGSRDGMP